jgi:L-malate glycosyltransferase
VHYKKNRVLLLGDINSPHTQKWAKALAQCNTDIGIFSFNHSKSNWWATDNSIQCLHQSKIPQTNSILSKFNYIRFLPKLIYSILNYKPQLIHAHYLSSYGLLGALTCIKPFVVSAWGSDIITFPNMNNINKMIIKFVLWQANKICVTSTVLKSEVEKYTTKQCIVIPYGVDLSLFYQNRIDDQPNTFTFGCVKHFEKIYNLDKVVEGFYLLVKKYSTSSVKLKLIGDGSLKQKVQQQVHKLGIEGLVEFVGSVENSSVPAYLNSMDALINVSEYESFGVSVAEAMACKIPIIISNCVGFNDLIPDKKNASVSPTNSSLDIFKAMEFYYLNTENRKIAAEKNYDFIVKNFNLVNNVFEMKQVYDELI